MSHAYSSISTLIGASVLATALLSLPAAAGFVSVSRCNEAGGTSPPVLHFVNGGDRFIVRIGERGLTRNVIFNERAARAWAAASGLFPEGTVFGNYSGFICGLPSEDIEVTEEPLEPAEPEEPEQPECEGDECEPEQPRPE